MIMKRRQFIRQVGTGAALLGFGGFPLEALASPQLHRITILHTNDVHSRIDPFPLDGSRNQGLGGAARRAAWIRKVRAENEHVLLFDSGDIFQGTPYFNFFKGELEIRLMNEMGYDAATIGNHDFDAGIDRLAEEMDAASFPFLNVNYGVEDTVLHGRVQSFKIFEKGPVRIGVTGVGIELEGLVPRELCQGTVYRDPVADAEATARFLKKEMDCDYVILLSHLGYRYREDKISDVILAANTRHVDLILGGHTHTFMKEPHLENNLDGQPVIIHQCGWAGILLGRIDLVFERNRRGKCVGCRSIQLQS